jgi:cellulose synthase/poly-beta-1,6-N-acetylglucosamine synthase-like glycosyltransferase
MIGMPVQSKPGILGAIPFIGAVLALAILNGHWFAFMNGLDRRHGVWLWVYGIKAGVEFVGSVFAMFYMLVALTYRPRAAAPSDADGCCSPWSKVAVLYLCCDDLQEAALETLARFCARTSARLVVHDDSGSGGARLGVDRLCDSLRLRFRIDVAILRRPARAGGKPGAVNYAVEALGPTVDFILLCDSDSSLPTDDRSLEGALAYFSEPGVAIVQFRNIGVAAPHERAGYRILSDSVDFYDVFVSFMDRYGWSPFLGHNALIRVSAFRAVGGFTPGQLADDIDFSAKLRLAGYRIRYARFVAAGERHPHSYPALRLRTEKWAYGCTQIMLRWGVRILLAPSLSAGEKVTFFLTVGYYHFQSLLLLYLTLFYLVLPFHDPRMGGTASLLVSAALILLLTFVPSVTYFLRGGRLRSWPAHAVVWGLTFGSQDLVILSAIVRCLLGRPLSWSPTNAAVSTHDGRGLTLEICFGASILVVAALQHPALLLLPTTGLFAGKFLVASRLNSWMWRPRIEALPHPSINSSTARGDSCI